MSIVRRSARRAWLSEWGPLGGSIVRSTGPMYRVSASGVSLTVYWLYNYTIHGTIATDGSFTRARSPGTIDRKQVAGLAGRRQRSRSPGHYRGMTVRFRDCTRNSDVLRGVVGLRPPPLGNSGPSSIVRFEDDY